MADEAKTADMNVSVHNDNASELLPADMAQLKPFITQVLELYYEKISQPAPEPSASASSATGEDLHEDAVRPDLNLQVTQRK